MAAIRAGERRGQEFSSCRGSAVRIPEPWPRKSSTPPRARRRPRPRMSPANSGAGQGCRNLSPTLLDSPMVLPPMFDHERLDVYQLELKFLTWVTQFLADIAGPSQTPTRELRDQLDRASLWALLNTAEGNGRRVVRGRGRRRARGRVRIRAPFQT